MQEQDLTLFWNRQQGKFVNKITGQAVDLGGLSIGPIFTGTIQEWYETLVETLIDCRNQLRRHVGDDEFTVKVTVDPDTFVMLNTSVLFHPASKKKHAGKISDMEIVENRHANRLTAKVEVSTRKKTLTGHVIILED